MAAFKVPAADGTYNRALKTGKFHDIIVKGNGTMTGGTLTVKCQPFGAADDVYNAIPSGAIDLSSPEQIQFTGGVQAYQFIVENFAGDSTELTITDFVGWV